jgi:glyoxylase-like metal-dependent hydrolase (beta-lactamase superfamily II)
MRPRSASSSCVLSGHGNCGASARSRTRPCRATQSAVAVTKGSVDCDAPAAVAAATSCILPPTGPAGVILRPLVRRTTFAGFTPQIQLDGPHRLDDYGVGAEMVPAGGHTPGSYVVLLDDGDAIVGDLIRGGFASGRIRPGHPLRHFFTEDRPGNRAAVQRVLDHNPARIYVGHGGPLAATDVRRRLDAIT